jgi:putative aldouronate transport system substrate-binding protein
MKKPSLKGFIALTAACMMTLTTFAGCTSAKKTDDKATGSTTNQQAASQTVAGMQGWKAFDKRVTITVPVYDRSVAGQNPVDNNYYTKWIQKEFGDKWNVDVKYVAIPRTDVMTKYNLLIAGGQTPTILMEYDYPKVAQWANDGAMAEISIKDFANVAPSYYKKMVDNKQLDYTKLNGKDYFVLSERPYYNTTFTFVNFFRQDWLDQLGMKEPKTPEEYTKVLDAIKAKGLTDRPLGMKLPNAAYVGNFGWRNFPVKEDEWAMHSSLGTASLTWEPTKKMLKAQNANFNKGYYSKEYDLDTKGDQEKADFINGKLFQYGGYMSANVDWLKAFYEKNPNAKLGVLNTTAGETAMGYPQMRADNPFGMIVGFSSAATKEQLKAAWMYMEWMSQKDNLFTLENGVEGKTFTKDKDGNPVIDAKYAGEEKLGFNMNIDYTAIVHASKTLPTIEATIKAITPQGLPQDFYQEILDNYKELKGIADQNHAYSDPVFATAIKSESEYSATLLNLYKEYSVKLTKAKPEEFDALYKELSDKYLKAGYQQIIDERLKAYKDGKTTKLPAGVAAK